MKRTKIVCPDCGQEISKSNFTKHQRRHRDHPETFKEYPFKLDHDNLECQFCGKLCKNRNSLCNHERLCKHNPNRQQSPFIAYNNSPDHVAWNKGLTKQTDERVAKQANSIAEYYKTNMPAWAGKHHNADTRHKISLARKAYLIEHPDKVPYKLNHSSKESYPEHYFHELFQNEGINLQREYYCLGYYLDFCDVAKKIDIEIDGEQHYVDERIIAHDEIRTKALEAAGWYIFRIRWSTYQQSSKEERIKIIDNIKQLLA